MNFASLLQLQECHRIEAGGAGGSDGLGRSGPQDSAPAVLGAAQQPRHAVTHEGFVQGL